MMVAFEYLPEFELRAKALAKKYRSFVDDYNAFLDELERNADGEWVLDQMTGMRQSKREYIRAIMDGTLNYYSATHEQQQQSIICRYSGTRLG